MNGAARGKLEPVMKMISSFSHVMLELKTPMRHDDLRGDFKDFFQAICLWESNSDNAITWMGNGY